MTYPNWVFHSTARPRHLQLLKTVRCTFEWYCTYLPATCFSLSTFIVCSMKLRLMFEKLRAAPVLTITASVPTSAAGDFDCFRFWHDESGMELISALSFSSKKLQTYFFPLQKNECTWAGFSVLFKFTFAFFPSFEKLSVSWNPDRLYFLCIPKELIFPMYLIPP